MRKFFDFIFSMYFAGTLMLIFAAAIGTATFIENDFGTLAAKTIVYNARWFEILLLVTAISLIGSVFKYKLIPRKRYMVLFFHLAFVVMLAGAGITRYFGYEGTMMIREGESSNQVISDNPYFQLGINDGHMYYQIDKSHLFTEFRKNRFHHTYHFGDQECTVRFSQFIPNDKESASAVILDLAYHGNHKEITLLGGEGMMGQPVSVTIDGVTFTLAYGSKIIEIPFRIHLRDFQLERYPGSQSPSSFASEVTVLDPRKNVEMPYRIFMNNILNYGGFRFFQSSYDKDEKGTILSVNHDKWGTIVTYLGYLILALGMILNLFGKNSRFRMLARTTSKLGVTSQKLKTGAVLIIFGLSAFSLSAQHFSTEAANIDARHSREFGKLFVQDKDGRIEPLNTLASEILRKVSRKDNIMGLNSDQVFLGMVSNPTYWQTIPIIKVSDSELKKEIGITGSLAAFNDFIDMETGEYKLSRFVNNAYNKKPSQRSSFDKDLIKVDERVNIVYMVYTGNFLNIFPRLNDPQKKWHNAEKPYEVFDSTSAGFVSTILPAYYGSVLQAQNTGDWKRADDNLALIRQFQERNGKDLIPSGLKSNLEVTYNKVNIFKRLFPFYSTVGFILLILLFINILNPHLNLKIPVRIMISLVAAGFVIHTVGLALRWYIAGHAPWSNGFETMIYIAWGTVLSGLIFTRKSKITLAISAILASLTLMVANLSWMDPQITNLVPVLKSYWLVIHVAVITASYSFLAIGALLGFMNLILIIFQNRKNYETLNDTIHELTNINEMNLIIGLLLVTIGTFLGAVWANESWGRYWGWDPKETWALVTVLVYAFVGHMRLIPGMRGVFAYNFAALIAFSSVLMTYFGVNYYLSGMHSYASGDPVPIPTFVYYTIAVVVIVSLLAYIRYSKMEKMMKAGG